MKDSTKNQVEGTLTEAKGAVKEKLGEMIGNPKLASEGKTEKIKGTVQKKIGEIEKVIGS